jgi:hypothetical protein
VRRARRSTTTPAFRHPWRIRRTAAPGDRRSHLRSRGFTERSGPSHSSLPGGTASFGSAAARVRGRKEERRRCQ